MRARGFHGGGCQNRRRIAMRRFIVSLSLALVVLLYPQAGTPVAGMAATPAP